MKGSGLAIWDRRPRSARWLDRLDERPEDLPARLLGPLGWIYAQAGALWQAARSASELPSSPPSIGIGNLRVGGTGKTPVVGDLVQALVDRGLRVGVLSRGHRAAGGGDEPQWLAELGAEVVVDPHRGRGFDRLGRQAVDVILLDDALQTRWRPGHCLALGLAADRARAPRPLPAGPAREFLSAARSRASLWAWRHDGHFPAELDDRGRAESSRELHFRLEPVGFRRLGAPDDVPLEAKPFRRAVLLTGVARPQGVEIDALAAGIPVAASVRFADHWDPSLEELRQATVFAKDQGADALLCTEKSAARLSRWKPELPVWVLRSRVRWWRESLLTLHPEWFA